MKKTELTKEQLIIVLEDLYLYGYLTDKGKDFYIVRLLKPRIKEIK